MDNSRWGNFFLGGHKLLDLFVESIFFSLLLLSMLSILPGLPLSSIFILIEVTTLVDFSTSKKWVEEFFFSNDASVTHLDQVVDGNGCRQHCCDNRVSLIDIYKLSINQSFLDLLAQLDTFLLSVAHAV